MQRPHAVTCLASGEATSNGAVDPPSPPAALERTRGAQRPPISAIFREEALRAAAEGPRVCVLDASWPGAARVAMVASLCALLGIPALALLAYVPTQQAEGSWISVGGPTARARFVVARHPRGSIEVGSPVEVLLDSAAASLRARATSVRVSVDASVDGSGGAKRLVIDVEANVEPGARMKPTIGARVTARFRPTPMPARRWIRALLTGEWS